jgi:hypothetical protein
MTTERDLIQRLADMADALDGRKPLVFAQGQAMDGFTALANFQALANEARAYLAQPEPEVLARVEFGDTEFNCPSDVVLSQYCDDWFFGNPRDEVDPVDLCRGAIKLFAQMPTPIPVEERLPGPEDTTDRNECWYWHPGEECWEMVPVVTYTVDEWTHWLPHWALPVPQP